MFSLYYEELSTAVYPSRLLHSFGVNGKISGSIGAIGEISGNVATVLHSPIGCGYHYRYSARRRHQPYYPLYCSDLTEEEIVFGGGEKLYDVCLKVWQELHPDLLVIVPSPVSDILNEDVISVSVRLRAGGVPAVAVRSELFSHRDKNYAKRRVKELSQQKIGENTSLEIELKGCGFTEALYAMVDQLMEEQEKIPHSVNIETVGWGSDGCRVLREIETFLNRCGITVNTWIPSADIEKLKKAPAAELNLVKRIRWARRMRERFGTDYLFLNNPGRYEGLDGVTLFYTEIAQKLNMLDTAEKIILAERKRVEEAVRGAKEELGRFRCCLVCRGLQIAPFTLKNYSVDYGIRIDTIIVRMTDSMRTSGGITPFVENNLLLRLFDAVKLYSPGAQVIVNPTRDEMRRIFSQEDAVVGTDDFSLEGLGAPLIPAAADMSSPSFESYERSVKRMLRRLKNAKERPELLLGRLPFHTDTYPRIETNSTKASRDMWEKMWLDRRREEQE